MTSDGKRRTPGEIRAIQEQLQVLADRPQLRHRLGYRRASTAPPFADSRRPTDSDDASRRHVMDVAGRTGDREKNYATGSSEEPVAHGETDMGMDVYGKKPAADVGRYFRNNVWWWRALWDYVEEVAPQLAERVEHGHSNVGDGLGARDAVKLAAILTEELDAGRTARYEAGYTARIEALPDEQCWLCGGSGTRTDDLAVARGWTKPRGCNACKGTGTVRPRETAYPFSAENVAEFRDFLVASGGFEIW